MDAISTSIMAALATQAAGSELGTFGNAATIKAYKALKDAIYQKYGADSDVVDAIESLEQKPTSAGRKQVLKEEIALAQANEDGELIGLANTLLDKISATLDDEDQFTPETVPHLQRPVRPDQIIGRKAEVAQLLEMLQPGQVVAVCGPDGIGKGRLIAEAIWQLAPAHEPPQRFPDGIIYHNFHTQPRVDIALEHIARTFNEELSSSPYDAVQRALVKRQALLVLEGSDWADDLQGLLDVRGGCAVLLTGQQVPEKISHQIQLAALLGEDAVKLLQSSGGDNAKNTATATQICELLGGSPLGIQLAGGYLKAQNVDAAGYVTWLSGTQLSQLDATQRQLQSIPLVLKRTIDDLSDTARQALAVVGVLAPTSFDENTIIEALTPATPQPGVFSKFRQVFGQKNGENLADVGTAVRELAAYGLLRQVDERYQIRHIYILDYVRQHLELPKKALRRLVTYFVGLTWELGGAGIEGYTRLDAERPHLIRLLGACLEHQDWEVAHGLAIAIEDFLDLQGFVTERIIANETGLIAAWQLGRTNEAAWMGNLGDAYRSMGQAKWAIEHFEKALATARKHGDWQSEGNWLGNLGLAHRDLGQIEQARQYLKESEAIFEEISSPKAALVRDWLAELEEWEE